MHQELLNRRDISRLAKSSLFLLLLFGALGGAGQASPVAQTETRASVPTGDELKRRIETFETNFDVTNRLSGVLLIARGDEIILHEAYGYAHVGLAVRNQLSTPIGIASITKIMTQVMLSQLIVEQKLTMDTPIAKWLPDFPRAGDITIEHLARHRAGIPHRVTTAADEALPLSPADIVDRAAHQQLVFEPGSASAYSSAGYTVLARCIELAENKPYSQILSERIFQPAGMSATVEATPGREIPGKAEPYVPGRGELWPAPKKDLAFLAGAGSVFSNAADMWRFVQALRANKLVVPFDRLANNGRVGWTGASNGYFAFVDTYPDENLTCIWLGNSWGGCAGAMRDALPAIYRGETVTPAARPVLTATPPINELADCVGAYESRPGAFSDVRITGGELWFSDSMLLAIGKDRYWHQPWNCEVAFVRDEHGKVIAAERRSGNENTRWPKK